MQITIIMQMRDPHCHARVSWMFVFTRMNGLSQLRPEVSVGFLVDSQAFSWEGQCGVPCFPGPDPECVGVVGVLCCNPEFMYNSKSTADLKSCRSGRFHWEVPAYLPRSK